MGKFIKNNLLALSVLAMLLSGFFIHSQPAEAGCGSPPYIVTVKTSNSGGIIKVNDEVVPGGSEEYSFDTTTQLKLEAYPEPGYRFFRWSGNVVSEKTTVLVDINCDKTFIAVFDPITPVLTVVKQGHGSISPAAGRYYYQEGAVVSLTAIPDDGWKFDGWTSNVENPNSPATSLTVASDMTVTAHFSRVWPIWMILGIIMGAIVLIGGVVWFFTSRHRKQFTSGFLRFIRSSNTSLIFRLILGGAFVFAGLAKVSNISMLVNEIQQYQILPNVLASTYGHILPYLEILVGILLIFGIALRISASVAGLLILSFAIAKIVAIILKLDIEVCNCFGPAVPLLATQSLAIDIILLAFSIQIILFRNELVSMPSWIVRRKTYSKRSA